jgi:hypothetical protein
MFGIGFASQFSVMKGCMNCLLGINRMGASR